MSVTYLLVHAPFYVVMVALIASLFPPKRKRP